MKKYFFSSIALIVLGVTLQAQEEPLNFDLGFKAGLTSLNNDNGWNFEKMTLAVDGVFDLGYVIKPRIDFAYVNVDEKRGSVNSLWQVAADGQYDFELTPEYPVDIYLFAGVGYEYVSGSRKGFESQFFLQGGGGLKYPVNQNFSFVTEFKALQMLESSSSDEDSEYVILIGASVPFHTESREVPDQDGDGVLNADDLCPNTPPGVRVDADGCRIISKKPKPKVVRKTEKIEKIEKPAVVASAPVVTPRKAIDSDHDGIPDSLDKCPNTPAGFSVDTHGCGTKKRLEVHFESNSATLTPDSMLKIKAFAAYMKRMPGISVTIEGYTDSSGDPKKNMQLSQQRANAVKQALIKEGIKASRITAVGKGALNPIADNDTPEGRAKNRRIEAIIYQ